MLQHGVPFVARGSGTSLSGGSLPVEDGVVIALNRLNRIISLDPQRRLAVVEPGTINLDVSKAAAPYGLYYAPDPSSQLICTIGGNLAFNSGGAHCLKYGMTANHVLGIKVVLPDGEVVQLGGESLEMVGPDLAGFFVGSEGLFGVALEITLRLMPRPEMYRTVLAAYNSLEAAGNAVSQVVASGLLPGALEIMDNLAIQAAEAAVHAGYPRDAAGLLIVELEGERVQVEAEFAHLLQVIDASSPYEVRVAKDDADRARIWKGRKSAFSAVGRLSPDYIVQDGVVPRSHLGEALVTIQQLSAKHNLRVANVFHAGDGNLHPLILYNGRTPGELARAEQLAGEILTMCIGLGGSITGEHGIGVEKLHFMPAMFTPTDLALMAELRRAIDPGEIANRGKKIAVGEAPALASHEPASVGKSRCDFTRVEDFMAAVVDQIAIAADSAEAVQDAVRNVAHLLPRGGGTKTALSAPRPGATVLDLTELSGMIEYEPGEFVFTALAGTPLQTITTALAEHGQYLPFDPPLVAQGATLGGTVAAGLSGSGRQRYGGLRDFLIGARFVDGQGRLVRSGGKVVKNAAGFDQHKLLIGSLGRLGVIVEVSFKVFPQPQTYRTLRIDAQTIDAAVDLLGRLALGKFDIEALDVVYDGPAPSVLVRLGGWSTTLDARIASLRSWLGQGAALSPEDDLTAWQQAGAFTWLPAGMALVKIPLTLKKIAVLEAVLEDTGAARRYGCGGNLAWIGWPGPLSELDGRLSLLGLSGLVLLGPVTQPLLGTRSGSSLAARIKRTLDPHNKFLELA